MTDPTKTPTAINQRNIRSFAFETEPPPVESEACEPVNSPVAAE